MDKPKITGSEHSWEWEMVRSDKFPDGDGTKDTYEIVIGADDLTYAFGIATIWQMNQRDDSETIANAKAIKEVPNMIDALIGIVFDYYEQNDLSPAIKEAKKVLKDAGVEFEKATA